MYLVDDTYGDWQRSGFRRRGPSACLGQMMYLVDERCALLGSFILKSRESALPSCGSSYAFLALLLSS